MVGMFRNELFDATIPSRPFLLLRIDFPGKPFFKQLPPDTHDLVYDYDMFKMKACPKEFQDVVLQRLSVRYGIGKDEEEWQSTYLKTGKTEMERD